MALNLLPIGTLGAVETNGAVTFGVWLPWVSAADGNSVVVKIVHEHDQFLQGVPPREFPLTHSVRAPYGDFWSGTVPIADTEPAVLGWGSPGRYVYRYAITNRNVGTLDWIIDPCAREFGVGKLSAFTLGYQSYIWSEGEAQWRTPPLSDLIMYEVNIAELGCDLERVRAERPTAAVEGRGSQATRSSGARSRRDRPVRGIGASTQRSDDSRRVRSVPADSLRRQCRRPRSPAPHHRRGWQLHVVWLGSLAVDG
jgi:hypothetical protein